MAGKNGGPLLRPGLHGVVVVGNSTLDHVFTVPAWSPDSKRIATSYRALPGGQAANAATTLVALGWPVHFVGAFGDDEAGRASLKSLEQTGCDTTGCTVVRASGHTAVVVVDTDTGARSVVDYRDPRQVECAASLHLNASWFRERLLLSDGHSGVLGDRAMALARAEGSPVVSDIEGADGKALEELAPVDELIGPLDVVLSLCDERAADLGAHLPPVMIGTAGPRGSVLLRGGGHRRWVAATAVDVVDSTGAGDAYHAGYVAARLSGLALLPAMQFATRVAAAKCATAGPRANSRDLAVLSNLLHEAGNCLTQDGADEV